MQCGIDCSITVEFFPAIMMGGGYFVSAGAVAVWAGEQRSEPGEGFTYAQCIRQFRTCSKRASLIV
jgi:hypothetical protein